MYDVSKEITSESTGCCKNSESFLPVKMFLFFLLLGFSSHHGQKLGKLNISASVLVEFVNDRLKGNKNRRLSFLMKNTLL